MSRSRILRFYVIPVAIGLLITVLAYRALAPRQAAMTQQLVTVLAAAQDIPAKALITNSMLATRQVPANMVDPDMVTQPQEVLGKYAAMPMVRGEFILKSKIVSVANPPTLSYDIPKGLRAMTIRVDEISGVSGFPAPGDRIDIIGTFEPQNSTDERRTRLIVQDIPILAVGQNAVPVTANQGGGSGPKTTPLGQYTSLTIAVTPEQAAAIALAEDSGKLQVLLRPATDLGFYPPADVTQSQLFKSTWTPELYRTEAQLEMSVVLMEVDTASLSDLLQHLPAGAESVTGAGGGVGIYFHETPDTTWNTLNALIQAGKAKVIDQSDLTTINRQTASYSRSAQANYGQQVGGLQMNSWVEDGIFFDITPVIYTTPFIDMQMNLELQSVDWVQSASQAAVPVLNDRRAQAVVRINEGEVILVTGLVRPQDLQKPANVLERDILPSGDISPAVQSGVRQLILVVLSHRDVR